MNKKIILVAAVILIIVGGLFLARTFLFPQSGDLEVAPNIKIFVIAEGTDGEKIGCDDNLIPYEITATVPTSSSNHLEAAMLALLITEPTGDRVMNNALLASDLQLAQSSIDSQGKAKVDLTGNLSLGGVCDGPRVQNQIEKTALAVPGVSSVEIFVNGIPLADVLSQN